MQTLFILCGWMTMGYLTGYMARLKNRDELFWFVMGIMFTRLAMVILALLPKKPGAKKTKCRVPKVASPSDIMEVHNEASVPFGDEVPDPQPSQPRLRMPPSRDVKWYYLDTNAKQLGPLKINELRKLALEKTISLDTYVWHAEMAEWTQLKDFTNYSLLFDPDYLDE